MKAFQCFVAAVALSVALISHSAQAALLVADYEFNVAGNLGLDTSGLGNHAVNTSVTQGLDRFGAMSAGSFNGSSSKLVESGGLAGYTGLPGFTFAAWVNRSSADGGHSGIVSQDNGVACCTNRFLFDPNDRLLVDAGAHADFTYAVPVIPNDSWVHLIMTADDSVPGNQVNIYLNGVFAGTHTFGHNLANGSLFNTYVGAGEFGGAHFFQGLMDDVQVYQGAITASEAFGLFASGTIDVPEPASLSLLGMAALGLVGLRRRRA